MNFVLTLVSSDTPLTAAHIASVSGLLDLEKITVAGPAQWLDRHKAADLPLQAHPAHDVFDKLRGHLAKDKIDVFITNRENRQKKLVLCDMDSTIVTTETLDELAAEAGIKSRIAEITERAMNGDLDFHDALRERVALLRGLPETALQKVLDATILSDGAAFLIKAMRQQGATCVLVSGGFTFFTGAVAKMTGFHHHHGNTLEIADGLLAGTVAEPILDKDSKLSLLEKYTNDLGLDPAQTMALGDGANDLPMLAAAGLGIGYRPKPLLRESLDNCIIHGDLSAALYAQGFGNLKN